MIHSLIAVTAGLLVGILIGLTGMGGGAVMTPFLILVLKMDPVLAVGTDLTFAGITKWISGLQHRREKNVNLRMVLWLAVGSLPASLLASDFIVVRAQPGSPVYLILPRLLGGVLILVALYTLARTLNWIKVDGHENRPPAWALILIGAVGGGLVGLTSVGSGTIIMAALLIFFSLSPAQLVGTDILHGAILTTLPALVYAFGGHVDWSLLLWLLLGSIPGSWLGARLVNVVPQRVVRAVLGVLLIIAGLRLFE